ncbi:hypothetical protein BV25DRAFT_1902902 [Artomyces pyxidatus]|uniref:Uncharacterized protein n=1 Tax=Artomyces pyxidatus TaxID=48021 RepID=A0ACB8SM86_9AGAM|nr:hypothetical protein BV25DRAFT_1902902 [Artomyces pyxidatus]
MRRESGCMPFRGDGRPRRLTSFTLSRASLRVTAHTKTYRALKKLTSHLHLSKASAVTEDHTQVRASSNAGDNASARPGVARTPPPSPSASTSSSHSDAPEAPRAPTYSAYPGTGATLPSVGPAAIELPESLPTAESARAALESILAVVRERESRYRRAGRIHRRLERNTGAWNKRLEDAAASFAGAQASVEAVRLRLKRKGLDSVIAQEDADPLKMWGEEDEEEEDDEDDELEDVVFEE